MKDQSGSTTVPEGRYDPIGFTRHQSQHIYAGAERTPSARERSRLADVPRHQPMQTFGLLPNPSDVIASTRSLDKYQLGLSTTAQNGMASVFRGFPNLSQERHVGPKRTMTRDQTIVVPKANSRKFKSVGSLKPQLRVDLKTSLCVFMHHHDRRRRSILHHSRGVRGSSNAVRSVLPGSALCFLKVVSQQHCRGL